jgi:glucosylceramidase
MVLNPQGGPNWFKNWCTAPVIADPEKDEIYFTPLYYTMTHFSKFIRPGAVRIDCKNPDGELMCTAAKNPDGSLAVVLFNPGEKDREINLKIKEKAVAIRISSKAIQTIIVR